MKRFLTNCDRYSALARQIATAAVGIYAIASPHLPVSVRSACIAVAGAVLTAEHVVAATKRNNAS